jgi:hypothetical protein
VFYRVTFWVILGALGLIFNKISGRPAHASEMNSSVQAFINLKCHLHLNNFRYIHTYVSQCLHRMARWQIFEPKIPTWAKFGGSCSGRCWYIFCPLGLFCDHLVYFIFQCLILHIDFWKLLCLVRNFFIFEPLDMVGRQQFKCASIYFNL